MTTAGNLDFRDCASCANTAEKDDSSGNSGAIDPPGRMKDFLTIKDEAYMNEAF